MSSDPESPQRTKRKLEPPSSPGAVFARAIKESPLTKAVTSAGRAIKTAVTGSSVAIGLADLIELSVEELSTILVEGRKSKEGKSFGWVVSSRLMSRPL